VLADIEPATDLAVVEPGGNQSEDFTLAAGEFVGGPGAAAAAGVEQDSGGGRVERRSAANHLPDAVENVLGLGVLE